MSYGRPEIEFKADDGSEVHVRVGTIIIPFISIGWSGEFGEKLVRVWEEKTSDGKRMRRKVNAQQPAKRSSAYDVTRHQFLSACRIAGAIMREQRARYLLELYREKFAETGDKGAERAVVHLRRLLTKYGKDRQDREKREARKAQLPLL